MSNKRVPKRQQLPMSADESEQQPRPKAGPDRIIRRELLGEVGKGNAQVKRYRNVNATPLMLAYDRDQLWSPDEFKRDPKRAVLIAKERLEYGEKFENWWKAQMGTGSSRDSTLGSVGGGGQGRTFSEQYEHAKRQIAHVRTRMSSRNYLIVEAFCAEGYSMVDALRKAGVEAHPVGTAYRIREALDDLVCVLTGRLPVPILVRA